MNQLIVFFFMLCMYAYIPSIWGDRYDYGMVAQALAAGLQTTLKEYAVLVSYLVS